jgi:transposase
MRRHGRRTDRDDARGTRSTALAEAGTREKILQKQAAEKMQVTVRWVRTLLETLKQQGDRVVVHGLRGRASNHKTPEKRQQRIMTIIQREYADFGPTLACEYLAEKHQLKVSKETLRKWMVAGGVRL